MDLLVCLLRVFGRSLGLLKAPSVKERACFGVCVSHLRLKQKGAQFKARSLV
jgi:hypothetical protein